MKFGVISLDFKRLPLEETFRMIHDYGFDGLEIFGSRCHLDPADWSDEICQKVIALKDKYEIEIPMYTANALNLPLCICSPNASERSDGVAYYKKAVDIASAIGAPRILVVVDHPGYFTPRREVWKYTVDSMKQICAHAHGKNVQVTVEPLTPMESPVISTVDDCVELIEDVNDPFLYAMMDVAVPTVVHEPLSKYFHMLGDRLNYIHICNNDGCSDAHTRLGEGILPIEDVIRIINLRSYQGFVTSELYSEGYFDPEMMLSNTARILKDICNNQHIPNHFL